MRPILTRISFLTCALVLAIHGVTHGEGYRIPYLGTAAASQGEAFVAQADDASALHYNPAGLTQVEGVQFYFGANFITGSTEFTSTTGARADSDLGGSVALPPPIHAYLTWNLKNAGIDELEPLTLGIGVNSPFGLKIRWPDDGPFSTTVTEAALQLLDIKPTLAYRASPMLSLGLGLDIYTFWNFVGEGQTEIKSNDPTSGLPTELNGTDTTVGFNVSALYTHRRNTAGKPRLNLGVVYRSGTDLHLEGEFIVNGAKAAEAEAKLPIPQLLAAGVAYWPVRDQEHEWKLEFDFEWIEWSTYTNLDVAFSTGAVALSPRDWKDTYTFSVGTEFKWLNPTSLPKWEVALRGGYQRAQAPNSSVTWSPLVPDANINKFSTGLGLKCKKGGHFFGYIPCGYEGDYVPKAMVLDLGFTAVFWEERAISGNVLPLGSTLNGTYETKDWYVGHISLGAAFGQD